MGVRERGRVVQESAGSIQTYACSGPVGDEGMTRGVRASSFQQDEVERERKACVGGESLMKGGLWVGC